VEQQIKVDCPFCGHTIVGEYLEDIDAHIMKCRDRHPDKGRLTEEACVTRPVVEIPPFYDHPPEEEADGAESSAPGRP
jgi:hypothetical protein